MSYDIKSMPRIVALAASLSLTSTLPAISQTAESPTYSSKGLGFNAGVSHSECAHSYALLKKGATIEADENGRIPDCPTYENLVYFSSAINAAFKILKDGKYDGKPLPKEHFNVTDEAAQNFNIVAERFQMEPGVTPSEHLRDYAIDYEAGFSSNLNQLKGLNKALIHASCERAYKSNSEDGKVQVDNHGITVDCPTRDYIADYHSAIQSALQVLEGGEYAGKALPKEHFNVTDETSKNFNIAARALRMSPGITPSDTLYNYTVGYEEGFRAINGLHFEFDHDKT